MAVSQRLAPTLLSSLLLASSSTLACRGPQREPETTAVVEPEPQPSAPVEGPQPADDSSVAADPDPAQPSTPTEPERFDLVVAFFSPGNGTDHEAASRLDFIVGKVEGLRHTRGHWGKEGEHDECFDLSALSAAQRRDFLTKVRAAVGSSDRVTITEHAPCRNDR